jgi:hypothetical protein
MRVSTLRMHGKSIRENIKTTAKDNLGYHRLKHNKPWFDDGCSKLIDQRKQAKLFLLLLLLRWLYSPMRTFASLTDLSQSYTDYSEAAS